MKREKFRYSIGEVAPFIDWSYLLHAWQVEGKKAPSTANDIMRDAHAMLHELDGKHHTHSIFALCNAIGDGDNIIIEGTTLPLLRQQHSQEERPNLCLSDFISPHGDLIGLFATSVDRDFGSEYTADPYLSLLAQTIADRLAEATATIMHRAIRTDKALWGYSPDEKLTIEQLHREEHQGIRPAVGYPSLPDQSIIFIIDKLLRLEDANITLTPNGAMEPHAAVCGLMIAHPQARYFNIGRIDDIQLHDYAKRRGMNMPEISNFLSGNTLSSVE